MVVTRRGRSL